jgi:thiosulfate/3-mercaptopyruvate sulfurtransferase
MHTTLIPPAALAARLFDLDLAIIDCRFTLVDKGRGHRDYLAGHIPGAVYAHLDDDLAGPIIPGLSGRHPLPDPDAFARRLGEWGIGEGVQVVAYDDAGGAYAARLWWMLRWLGHEAVAVLDGGWQAWLAEGWPAAAGRETRPLRVFSPHPRPELLATTAEVDAIRLDPGWRLLDARGADRFRGENETLDPVAGHIPGALSLPYTGNLGPDGRFLPPQDLAARFAPLLGHTPAQRIVCSCGSGVTAAHNLLAMLHAGLGEGRLYAGSWSEWITDPSRPVAVG